MRKQKVSRGRTSWGSEESGSEREWQDGVEHRAIGRRNWHTWLAEAEKARFWKRLKDWRAANMMMFVCGEMDGMGKKKERRREEKVKL